MGGAGAGVLGRIFTIKPNRGQGYGGLIYQLSDDFGIVVDNGAIFGQKRQGVGLGFAAVNNQIPGIYEVNQAGFDEFGFLVRCKAFRINSKRVLSFQICQAG